MIHFPFDDIKESYKKKLEETRENEIYRGVTLSGPHRDDLGLYVNNIDMRRFGLKDSKERQPLHLNWQNLNL